MFNHFTLLWWEYAAFLNKCYIKLCVEINPKGLNKPANGDRGKRDILDPFTSFYLAKNAQQQQDSSRNKREDQVSISTTI